jgi:hypothetical protein
MTVGIVVIVKTGTTLPSGFFVTVGRSIETEPGKLYLIVAFGGAEVILSKQP